MKTKTIKLNITGILLVSSIILFAQEQAIEFTYDAAGNRTERHVIELKSPENGIPDSYQKQGAETEGGAKSSSDVVFTE